MIIVELKGGLGNQMFQYAAGLSLAYLNNTDLLLDKFWFSTQAKRKYALDVFNIKPKFMSLLNSLRVIKDYDGEHIKKFKQTLLSITNIDKPRVITNSSVNSFTELSISSENVYISGYWQSEKYFKIMEDLIRKEFSFKEAEKYQRKFKNILKKMGVENSVAMHVRRGDYVMETQGKKGHVLLENEYYQKCISNLNKAFPNLSIYVFTDDPIWVNRNLRIGQAFTIVSKDNILDHEELFLMTQCKHQIIANSSFSWWGAWLNDYPDKIVYAPENWLHKKDRNKLKQEMIPNTWKKV